MYYAFLFQVNILIHFLFSVITVVELVYVCFVLVTVSRQKGQILPNCPAPMQSCK